ncbi:MAG: SOS response-associated peptidase [Hyphomicrobiales bacterium]|nr:SOS response-associated peptidase [Hyphomicrobiales bacterium]
MCGRFTQKDSRLPGLEIAVDAASGGAGSAPPRYNGAPSQDFWVIRRHPETGLYHRDRLIWGLIPGWVKEADGGRKPINARSETITTLPSFRGAYAKRRCLIPIDNFFEWRKTTPPKQPFAIAMKDRAPFALAGIWENWKHPESGEHIRTFCLLTCPANALIAAIHDRMPVIIPAQGYDRWLSLLEADPRDLLAPYPAEEMVMWPVSARVNAPRNDDPGVLDPLNED